MSVCDISSLNPYMGDFRVKVKITKVDGPRTVNTRNGETKVCSGELVDSKGAEIRFSMWGDVCEANAQALQKDSVIIIADTGKAIRFANKKYTSIRNDYELSLGHRTRIEMCSGDDSIKGPQIIFAKLESIKSLEPNLVINIVAAIHDVQEPAQLTTKTNRTMTKRDITLVDDSDCSIQATLWGEQATRFTTESLKDKVIIIKDAKIGDFGGRSISSIRSSEIIVDGDSAEAEAIKKWYATGPSDFEPLTVRGGNGGTGVRSIAGRKTVGDISEMGRSDPEYANTAISIKSIRHDRDPWYSACVNKVASTDKNGQATTRTCNKKVTVSDDQSIECPICGTVPSFTRRFIMNVEIVDHVGTAYTSFFDEQAIKLLGSTADEIHEKREELKNTLGEDEVDAAYSQIFDKHLHEQLFISARCSYQEVRGEMRSRVNVNRVNKISFEKESKAMIAALKEYKNQN
eukprot:TRINITY_DN17448_c0_g1_i1.p1 TRINITY_DN17448_c0_g1~~TRINITY_DN17448_c0_g1_i1.p1  ORF type:complete len:460 (-),score=140.11 TRINITY_DN17448_c0_g1_i1:718-2097(-)